MMGFGCRLLSASVGALAVVAVAACGQATPPEPAAPANPLAGAWSVSAITGADGVTIDPAQPGLFVFTDGHYSAVYTPGAEPRPASATHFVATDEEALAQFQSFIVNAGTYSVDGSTITFRPSIARAPEFVGGQATAEFEIAGDVLTLRYQTIVSAGGANAPDVGSMTLRRLE